jgi:hypothetical protein
MNLLFFLVFHAIFLFPYILLKIFHNLFYCLFMDRICTSCIMLANFAIQSEIVVKKIYSKTQQHDCGQVI